MPERVPDSHFEFFSREMLQLGKAIDLYEISARFLDLIGIRFFSVFRSPWTLTLGSMLLPITHEIPPQRSLLPIVTDS